MWLWIWSGILFEEGFYQPLFWMEMCQEMAFRSQERRIWPETEVGWDLVRQRPQWKMRMKCNESSRLTFNSRSFSSPCQLQTSPPSPPRHLRSETQTTALLPSEPGDGIAVNGNLNKFGQLEIHKEIETWKCPQNLYNCYIVAQPAVNFIVWKMAEIICNQPHICLLNLCSGGHARVSDVTSNTSPPSSPWCPWATPPPGISCSLEAHLCAGHSARQ